MHDSFFKTLSDSEVLGFRQWARDNHTPGGEVNDLWHPEIRTECEIMDREVSRPLNRPGEEHLSQLTCARCGDLYAGEEDDPASDYCTVSCEHDDNFDMRLRGAALDLLDALQGILATMETPRSRTATEAWDTARHLVDRLKGA